MSKEIFYTSSSFGMVCRALVDSLSPAFFVLGLLSKRKIVALLEKIKNEPTKTKPVKKNLFFFRFAPLHYGDCVIYGFPMAFGLGRVGCFLQHDHPGIRSDFPLAVKASVEMHGAIQLSPVTT